MKDGRYAKMIDVNADIDPDAEVMEVAVASAGHPFPPRRAAVAWLLLLAVLVSYVCLFDGLTAIGLVGPDEPRYAAISRAMATNGDWVTPRLNGEPWLEKPILFYWAAASAYRLVGDSELAPRLPSALSTMLTSLALGLLGWRLYGATTAAVVLVLFPTTVAAFAFARGATTDMLFAASLTLTMMTAAHLLISAGDRRHMWQAAFGATLGLAVLAKGPAGLLLAGGSLTLWGLASSQVRRLRVLTQPLAIASFASVVLPWYVLSAARNPELVEVFLIRHNLERFLTPVFQHQQPFWFFGPILALGLAPWSAFLVPGIWRAWRKWRAGQLSASPSLYIACWVAFPILFFSLSKSKLPRYILPAVPAAALLLARTVSLFLDRGDGRARWPLFGTAAVLAGLAAALAVPEMVIAEVPGLPLGTLRPLAPVVGLASLAVAGTAFWRNGYVAVATVALAFAIGIAYLNTSMMPRLAPLVSPRTVASLVRETGRVDDVAVYRLHRAWHFGLNYYLNRDLPEWDERQFLSPPLVVTNSQGILALEAQDVPVEILDYVSAEGVLVTLPPSPPARGPAHGK